jgi:hypothetical protein
MELQTTNRSYPEIVGNKCRGENIEPPIFPDNCPICHAKKISENKDIYRESCKYKCGGEYKPKPQIQNHTDYYWGRCLYNKK